MASRRPAILALVLICALPAPLLAASYRTTNFVVEAPTPEIARQIGQYAEHYRKEKAMQWLGREMPTWGQPCPLRVTVTRGGPGGATSFVYEQGQVLGQNMHIEGPLDRLLASVLPHEITHTVFAYYFRQPVPRWADEGGSVLSEDSIERNRHDMLVWQILNTPGRAIPLRRLFSMKEYPRDVMCLYAQGYSVTAFLVSQSGRPAFLQFLSRGMREGWDRAVSVHYRYRNVEELEQAWVAHLKEVRRNNGQLAYQRPAEAASGRAQGGVLVRQTVPPVQPFGYDASPAQPVYRGQAPDSDQEPVGWANAPQAASRPAVQGYNLPRESSQDRWQAAPPPRVTLGPPQSVR